MIASTPAIWFDRANPPRTQVEALDLYSSLGLSALLCHPGGKRRVKIDHLTDGETRLGKLRETLNAKTVVKDGRPLRPNIAILLGEHSGGLIDIDLDIAAMKRLFPEFADRFLPPGAPSFGRRGKPAGHFLYRVAKLSDSGRTKMYGLSPAEAAEAGLDAAPGGEDKLKVVEVRSTGGYTVMPGSVLGEDPIVFDRWGTPPIVESRAELERRIELCAALALVLSAYPAEPGNRNEICLALTGALVKVPWLTDDDADWIVSTIARLGGDEESRGGRAADTRAKIESGEPAWGLTKLCELLGFDALRKRLHQWMYGERERAKKTEADAAPPPDGSIVIADHLLNQVIERSEEALQRAGAPIYRRDGLGLARVLRLSGKAEGKDGIKRDAGALVIDRADKHWLVQQMLKAAPYFEFDGRAGQYVPAAPTLVHGEHLRARVGDGSPFPPLRMVSTTPLLRPDGTIIQTPGFDPDTGILYEPSAEYPPVPEHPTRLDALKALARLKRPYRLFPFVADEPGVRRLRSGGLSVVLSAEFCLLARPALKTVPCHLFDAPEAGSGKTKLSNCVSITGTGAGPSTFDHGFNRDEFEKRVGAAMLKGDRCVCIDNIDGPFGGPMFCSVLTGTDPEVRTLGKSKNVKCANATLFIGNGNNITPEGDLPRRCVRCRIDARTEAPDERSFPFDPEEVVRQTRVQRVTDALTVLRAYVLAGRPLPTAFKQMGSFEDYALVRGALVWLGMADPLSTREELRKRDPKKDELRQALAEWRGKFGDTPKTLAQVKDEVGNGEALFALLTGGQPVFNPRAVGNRLAGWRERTVAGLVLVNGPEKNQIQTWVVEVVGDADGPIPDYSNLGVGSGVFGEGQSPSRATSGNLRPVTPSPNARCASSV